MGGAGNKIMFLNLTIFDGVLLVVCFGSNFSWYSEPCGQGWNYYCIVYCLGLDCILQVWYLSGSSGLGLTGRLPFYPNPGQSWIRDAQRLFNLSPPTFYIEGGLNSSYLIQHIYDSTRAVFLCFKPALGG